MDVVGEDCPNCNNQGWFWSGDRYGHYDQVQCEWCITNPNSKFNVENSKTDVKKVEDK